MLVMFDSADFRALVCHPATRAPMIHTVEAGAHPSDGGIRFVYRVRGDMARVRLPKEGTPERGDSLWEHTCFEAFVAGQGDLAYREFNFSTSGQWAIYDFGGYRRRLADPMLEAPQIAARVTEGRLELAAWAPSSSLPSGSAWEIGLSAVIEAADTVDDGLSYWALRHPSPRPDFHRRERVILRHSPSEDRRQRTEDSQ
jgi:hypothetical protein